MNKEKIKAQVRKAIARFGEQTTFLRESLNEFKEPIGEEEVTTIQAYYHRGNSTVNVKISDAGKSISNLDEKLMIVLDKEGSKIKQDDMCVINGIKYRIIDINHSLGIYADMYLERV